MRPKPREDLPAVPPYRELPHIFKYWGMGLPDLGGLVGVFESYMDQPKDALERGMKELDDLLARFPTEPERGMAIFAIGAEWVHEEPGELNLHLEAMHRRLHDLVERDIDEPLRQVRAADQSPPYAATYPDRDTAATITNAVLRANTNRLHAWDASGMARCTPLRLHFDDPVGTLIWREDPDTVLPAYDAVVLVQRGAEGGVVVASSHPEPPLPPPIDLPMLGLLFGAYLDLDPAPYHPRWWHQIEAFRHDLTPSQRWEAILDKRVFNATTNSEDERKQAAFALGCCYQPRGPDEFDFFLEEVGHILLREE